MLRRTLSTLSYGVSIVAASALLGLFPGAVSAQETNVPPIVQAPSSVCCPQCGRQGCGCRLLRRFVDPGRFRCDPSCQPSCIGGQPSSVLSPDPASPEATPPADAQPAPEAAPSNLPPDTAGSDSFALSSGFGSGMESSALDATTIGDFFGGGGIISGPSWSQIRFTLPLAGGDRRYKLGENTSPIPADRTFFNYHYFSDPVSDINGNAVDVNRYTFGFERTFLDRNASIELRLPIANGVDGQQMQEFSSVYRANEVGNLSLTGKALLYRDSEFAYSTGAGVVFPTAADAEFETDSAGPIVSVDNEAYHVLPFFAVHHTPNRRNWSTFITQLDFAGAGNTVESMAPNGLITRQRYNDQNLLFFDWTFGHWLCRNPNACGRVRGLAAIFELHYTTTLNDTDMVFAGDPFAFDSMETGPYRQDVLTNPANRQDVLNATLGLRLALSRRTTVTLSGVAPLRDGDDKLFDEEFSIQISRAR